MTPTRLAGAYAAVAALLAAYFVAALLVGPFRAVERSDYMTYHVAARIVFDGDGACLYEVECQAEAQRELIGDEPSFEGGALPYNSPPWFAALVAPLGVLPLAVGFAVFTITGLAVLALAASALDTRHRLLAPLLVITAWPTAMAVIRGQSTLLVAGLLGLSVVLNRYRSGAMLGLAVLKPTLPPLWTAWQLLGGHWRAVATAVAMVLALVALSALVVGTDALAAYPQHLLGVAAEDAVGVHHDEMVNWRGAAARLGADAWFVVAGTAATLAALALTWFRARSRYLEAGAAFLATPLVIPHANQHETVLGMLGVLLVVCAADTPQLRWRLAAAAVASHAVLWAGLVLDPKASGWLLFGLLLAWLAVAVWHASRTRLAPP